jgi:hypothetical protein
MDSVTNFGDLPMADDDSVMDVTPHELSPSPRASFGESSAGLWAIPSSGISGLTGGGDGFVECSFVLLCGSRRLLWRGHQWVRERTVLRTIEKGLRGAVP